MKPTSSSIYQFIEKSPFIQIPIYQRNYQWNTDRCNRFFNDLLELVDQKQKKDNSHFMGCVVTRSYETKVLIIDGQQRIITASLLLMLMSHLLENSEFQVQIKDEHKDRLKNALKVYEKGGPSVAKLKLQKGGDSEVYEKILKKTPTENIDSSLSKIKPNYEFFKNKLKNILIDNESMANDLLDAVDKCIIVNIELEENDEDPQVIFDCINATGMSLSADDMIRNYMLMDYDPDKQEELYYNYWEPITKNVGNLEWFFSMYLRMTNVSKPQINIYEAFKDHVRNSAGNKEEVLKNLLHFSGLSRKILKQEFDDTETKNCVYRLMWLGLGWKIPPFFLSVLDLQDKKQLTSDDIKAIFKVIESYIGRRYICSVPTNTLESVFINLHNEVMKLDNTSENYVEKLKYILQIKDWPRTFPPDEWIVNRISNYDLFLTVGHRELKYLLERLSNYDTKEPKVDIYTSDAYSIEHIMPQSIGNAKSKNAKAWQYELGDDYAGIHERWVHKLANLTLTAYNSELGNKPFDEKKDIYKKSGLYLNHFIVEKRNWNENSLKERQKFLISRALDVWKYIKADYQPAQKPADCYTLSDLLDNQGIISDKKILSYRYSDDDSNECDTWKNLFVSMLKKTYYSDSQKLERIIASDPGTLSSDEREITVFINKDKEKISNPEEADFAKGLFFSQGESPASVIGNISKLFELYELDPEQLEITTAHSAEESEA